jgi:hypothetical protein
MSKAWLHGNMAMEEVMKTHYCQSTTLGSYALFRITARQMSVSQIAQDSLMGC